MMSDVDILLRLAVALGLTGILGVDRELSGKAAGLRTHMLVGIGAALFIVIGEFVAERFSDYGDHIQADPMRIVEAVVTGVSFLGAGMIFVSGGEQRVHGLTTAASIWMAAAIGMLAGLERYALATTATLLIFLILRALHLVSKRIERAGQDRSGLRDD